MSIMMKVGVSEKLVALAWQQQMVSGLITDSGDPIKVLYPGRPSNEGGCDFRDAVFDVCGKVVTGNVEIHVKSSQWYIHGHHKNPKYNDVSLHVVMWSDCQYPTLLQNGKSIPTIHLASFMNSTLAELQRHTKRRKHQLPICPSAQRHRGKKRLLNLLDEAGEQRFAVKANAFEQHLAVEDAGQLLFRGIARALGYSRNVRPFEKLTSRLTLDFLEKAPPKSTSVKRALILGTAGLLPSQRSIPLQVRDQEIDELETIWESNGTTDTMQETDWDFFRVRPHNFPTRRLVALSQILASYHKSGLLKGITKLLREAPCRAEHRWLENAFITPGQGYWANHCDFGTAHIRTSALLGRGKAATIIINAILPFISAWAKLSAEAELQKKAVEVYRRYPGPDDNELTHHMKQLLRMQSKSRLSACQQQGLIHIFKNYCCGWNCSDCPIAQPRLRLGNTSKS